MTTAPSLSPSPAHDTSPDWSTRPAPLAGPILTYTLASSVALWVAAFITHLPWINLPQRAASICVLVVWSVSGGARPSAATGLSPRSRASSPRSWAC